MADEDLFGDLKGEFLLESAQRLEAIEQHFLGIGEGTVESTPEGLNEIRRELHTLKGNAGMMGLREIQRCAHDVEESLEGLQSIEQHRVEGLLAGVDRLRTLLALASREGVEEGDSADGDDASAAGLIVPAVAIDALVDMLADTMIMGSRLESLMAAVPDDVRDPLLEAYESLSKNLSGIHRRALSLRLVPLKPLFASLHRLVHDESTAAGKSVQFVSEGGETPLDRALMEVASEALGHIVRNAVIHGIEPAPVRERRGKPVTGSVRASAASSGVEEICVTVEDDGAGIDRQGLADAASRSGMRVDDRDDLETLLYMPGLSTLEETTLSGGRGMGLSASASAVRRLGGRIEVETRPGKGTTFRVYLPLQVSMLRVMLVEADGARYAIPLTAVSSVNRMQPGELHIINGAGAVGRRRGLLPLLDLGVAFGTSENVRQSGTILTVSVGGVRRGLLVDRPGRVLDCVIKPLDAICGSVTGILGTTILSEGKVLLALDPAGLLERPLIRSAA